MVFSQGLRVCRRDVNARRQRLKNLIKHREERQNSRFELLSEVREQCKKSKKNRCEGLCKRRFVTRTFKMAKTPPQNTPKNRFQTTFFRYFPQGAPKMAQDAPKSTPRASESSPRAPKSVPGAPQERPKSVPRAPRSAPRAPKSAPRAEKHAKTRKNIHKPTKTRKTHENIQKLPKTKKNAR